MQKREAHWARLEALVAACKGRDISALSTSDLRELAQLYRQTAADLATAREDPSSRRLAAYLNQLLGRAHNLVYAGRRRERGGVFAFYARTFPQTFRATWRYTAAAVAVLAAGALAGAVLAATSPGFERFVLGGEMLDTIERREMWTHSILPMKPLASAGITANNLSVSIIAYASGILAGLGTLYIMAMNGLLLGVLGTVCQRAGMSLGLWSFVAPHGTLELPAIFIAGGAGLIIGAEPRRGVRSAAARMPGRRRPHLAAAVRRRRAAADHRRPDRGLRLPHRPRSAGQVRDRRRDVRAAGGVSRPRRP